MSRTPPDPEAHPLTPLLMLAREQTPDDRTRWLAKLRVEAPTVVAALEQLLRAPRPVDAASSRTAAPKSDCRFMIPDLRWGGKV